MSPEHVLVEPHGDVVVLRLSRPPANAFCLELARDFCAAFEANAVKHAKALVVTGTGDFFSGGLDLKQVPSYSPEQQREFLGVLNGVIGRLYGFPAPVVAAVNGHAMAGAFVLMLTADYRVGPTGDARFGLTEARVGIPFPAAPMVVVHAELAPQDLRFIALYARGFGSEEARRRGVFDELQPPGAVLGRALAVARDMASMPADAYRRIKQQVRGAALARIEEIVAKGADPMLGGWVDASAPEASAQWLAGSKTR
jgi:enoyl-CoA hydratase